MFIARGRTIALYSAATRNLSSILSELPSPRFTGRITYSDAARVLSLELQDGKIVGCAYQGPEGTVLGERCLEKARECMERVEGIIEVIELTPDTVRIDLDSLPGARLPRPVDPASIVPRKPAQPPPQPPTPTPRPAEAKPAAAAPKPAAAPPAATVTQPPPTPTPEEEVPSFEPVREVPGLEIAAEPPSLASMADAVINAKSFREAPSGAWENCFSALIDHARMGVKYVVCVDARGWVHRVLVEGRRVYAVSVKAGRVFYGGDSLGLAKTGEPRRVEVYM